MSSIWHDILLIPPPSPANEFSSPRHPGPPFPACTFSFVCRSAKSPSADCGPGSRKLRRRDDPLFLREKRKVVLGLDGSRIKTTLPSLTPPPPVKHSLLHSTIRCFVVLLQTRSQLLPANLSLLSSSLPLLALPVFLSLRFLVPAGRSPNPCLGASSSLSFAEAAEKEARGRPFGLQGLRTKSLERGAWGGGSGGSGGGALIRTSRIGGRDSLIGRVTLGAEEPEEEWGKSGRKSEEAEDQAEQAARQAREAEEAEKAAEQAREAEQTVLYAHSTWRILCPTLRRPVLKRLGSSHLPEKQPQQQELQDRLVRSPPVPASRSAYALPDSSYSASSESDSLSSKAACSSRAVSFLSSQAWSSSFRVDHKVTPPSSIPSSHSLVSTPSSHSLISIPFSHSPIQSPSNHSLVPIPCSHSLSLLPRPFCSPLQSEISRCYPHRLFSKVSLPLSSLLPF
ncbi:unnamed protein product [Closterium sp. Naga37s-1]|nr:unnamed protein product [Closterium sp. Naga37s-1]